MAGGVLALVATGIQNKDFHGNPQSSYFRYVLQKTTHFSSEFVQLQPENTFQFDLSQPSTRTFILKRHGDLLHRLYLRVRLPRLSPASRNGVVFTPEYASKIGYHTLARIELLIGSQRVQSFTREQLYLHHELYAEDVDYQKLHMMYNTNDTSQLILPLPFWFCQAVAQSLPMYALDQYEVKVRVQFEALERMVLFGASEPVTIPGAPEKVTYSTLLSTYQPSNVPSFTEFVDRTDATQTSMEAQYYFLSRDELNDPFFGSQDVMIGQYHTLTKRSLAENEMFDLQTSSLITHYAWYYRSLSSISQELGGISPISAKSPELVGGIDVNAVTLKLNGQGLFDEKSGAFFHTIQPYQYLPRSCHVGDQQFYVYHHAQDPMSIATGKYSGSLNASQFSRIQWFFSGTPRNSDTMNDIEQVFVYHTLNILSIMDGSARLKYAM